MNSYFSNRTQLAAIAELRWRTFLNGLRSKRAKLELASRILVTSAFGVGGFAGFAGAAVAAWYLTSEGKAEYLAVVLWPIFFFWQVFPVMATAFTNNPDSSDLLRFPLTYRSYFLIRLAYGYLDPASALGTIFSIGVLLGVSAARPLLFPWALLVLLTFVLFNLAMMQTIFAWLERWLAQRRTREILGVVFILAHVELSTHRAGHAAHGKGAASRLESEPSTGRAITSVAAARISGHGHRRRILPEVSAGVSVLDCSCRAYVGRRMPASSPTSRPVPR